jgi:hypothetical protein
MKFLTAILSTVLLATFQVRAEKTISDFAQTQLDNFRIIQPFEGFNFVAYIENQEVHNNKIELTLKAKKAHSNENSYGQRVYTRIRIWQLDFETNEKCEQTIESLLNCFPIDCFKIKRQVNQTAHIAQSIWILDKKRIIVAGTACEQVDKKWINLKRDLVKEFADSDTEIIVTECGKLTWKTKDEIMKNR